MKLDNIRQRALLEKAELAASVRSLGGFWKDCEVHLVGALQTGLYHGPKRRELSLNPDCPFSEVVEVDLRVVLPETRHPHDDAIVDTIIGVFRPVTSPFRRVARHWDRTDVPTVHLYKYSPLFEQVGLEVELSINRKPYVEIALFWHQLFSVDEIAGSGNCAGS